MSIKTIFKSTVLVTALMCLTFVTAWAQNETKVFSNSDIAAGSTNQLNYDGNLFICATGEATVSKANYNPYSIAMRAPYQQEGTLRLYPRISGKVKSIVFSSAYMFADEGYMKIGKGSTWTNSISEKNEGNNPWKSFEFTNADGIQLDNESDYLEIKLYHATKNGSFFTKGSITINYEPTTSTLTHNHNFSYNKNGSTLTATCAHDDGMDCSLASDNWQISTTLTPPTHATYAQYRYHPATLSNISEFTVETGATAGNITYVNNTTNENLGTSMPYEVGNYTANVTITAGDANYTLTTSYSVGTFCGINTNYPQFTTDKEGNYAVSGETVTLTFTSLYGETLTEVSAKGATSNNNITLTPTGINTYTFTMPTEEVNINATFGLTIDGSSSEQISITSDIEVDEVTYSRTFTADGGAYTIMLPFSFTVTNAVKGTFHTLSSIAPTTENPSVWKAEMSDAITTIEANKPYIFMPSGDFDKMIFENVTLEKTTSAPLINNCANSNWKLHGVYSQKVWTENNLNEYGFAAAAKGEIAAGEFVHFVTGATLKATRCYLEYSKDGFSKSAVVMPEKIIVVFPETSSVIEPNDPENNGDVITPVSEIVPNSGTKVWSYDGTIFIEAQPNTDYSVIDLTGRTLKTGVTTSTRETVTLSRRAAGIVIVKINGKTFKINY